MWAGDESCTDHTYARDTDKWLLTLADRVESTDKACGVVAR